jgi:hypothetical protein
MAICTISLDRRTIAHDSVSLSVTADETRYPADPPPGGECET